MTLLDRRRAAKPQVIDQTQVKLLGCELAEWRLAGCPGYDFHKVIGEKTRKAASKMGVSYSTLWAYVHAAAYKLIDEAHAATAV